MTTLSDRPFICVPFLGFFEADRAPDGRQISYLGETMLMGIILLKIYASMLNVVVLRRAFSHSGHRKLSIMYPEGLQCEHTNFNACQITSDVAGT